MTNKIIQTKLPVRKSMSLTSTVHGKKLTLVQIINVDKVIQKEKESKENTFYIIFVSNLFKEQIFKRHDLVYIYLELVQPIS